MISDCVQELILTIHRRNGGNLNSICLSSRLLDPVIGLDSLDLAEIMAAIEKRYGVSPFDSSSAPTSWFDVIQIIQSNTCRD